MPYKDDRVPLMLLALNATAAVDWEELQIKVSGGSRSLFIHSYSLGLQAGILAGHLAKPLGRFREHLAVPRPPLPMSATTSPPPRS